MRIYVSHAYGGKEENKRRLDIVLRNLQCNDRDNCYVSPIHALGYAYKDIPYDDGMELCFDLLEVCDRMIVIGEFSKGVKAEIDMANRLHIPIKYIRE